MRAGGGGGGSGRVSSERSNSDDGLVTGHGRVHSLQAKKLRELRNQPKPTSFKAPQRGGKKSRQRVSLADLLAVGDTGRPAEAQRSEKAQAIIDERLKRQEAREQGGRRQSQRRPTAEKTDVMSI